MMVFIRWAMVRTVESKKWVEIRDWIFCSVMRSMLEVASSRITSFDFLKMALQMHMSYLSPELKF